MSKSRSNSPKVNYLEPNLSIFIIHYFKIKSFANNRFHSLTIGDQSTNIGNYTNLKYTESSYRDYQTAKLNDFNATNGYTNTNAPNITNNSKFKPTYTDPSVYRYSPNLTLNQNQNGNTDANSPYNLTKIPLSPKSTLLKTNSYFNVGIGDKPPQPQSQPYVQPTLNVNGIEPITIKRPYTTTSGLVQTNNTANATESTPYTTYNGVAWVNANTNGPRPNLKFAYMTNNNNNNVNNSNQPPQQQQQQQQQTISIQRTLSAENMNRPFKPPNRFEIFDLNDNSEMWIIFPDLNIFASPWIHTFKVLIFKNLFFIFQKYWDFKV